MLECMKGLLFSCCSKKCIYTVHDTQYIPWMWECLCSPRHIHCSCSMVIAQVHSIMLISIPTCFLCFFYNIFNSINLSPFYLFSTNWFTQPLPPNLKLKIWTEFPNIWENTICSPTYSTYIATVFPFLPQSKCDTWLLSFRVPRVYPSEYSHVILPSTVSRSYETCEIIYNVASSAKLHVT